MSGGVELFSNLVLPYSRIVIIGFAAAVVMLIALAAHANAARPLRARRDAEPVDGRVRSAVPTGRVDTYAFGLGSGIAGLAGCALSQIGNVGPDLGQSYIVDSFMVVVLGGVGQLAGTVYAAMGLGIANKFLEAWSGPCSRRSRCSCSSSSSSRSARKACSRSRAGWLMYETPVSSARTMNAALPPQRCRAVHALADRAAATAADARRLGDVHRRRVCAVSCSCRRSTCCCRRAIRSTCPTTS